MDKKKKDYNLKFIKFRFKEFITVIRPNDVYKDWKETGIDLDGDTVLAIPRFFGKRKVVKLFIHGIDNYYKVLEIIRFKPKAVMYD